MTDTTTAPKHHARWRTPIAWILLVAAVGAVIPYVWLSRAHRKRQQLLNDQLADTLAILASSLRAGYSFLQALDTM